MESTLDRLLKLTPEQLTEIVKALSFNECINLKKHIEMEYMRAELAKNLTILGLFEKRIEEEKGNALLANLYLAMQKLEDMATIVEVFKKEKSVKA